MKHKHLDAELAILWSEEMAIAGELNDLAKRMPAGMPEGMPAARAEHWAHRCDLRANRLLIRLNARGARLLPVPDPRSLSEDAVQALREIAGRLAGLKPRYDAAAAHADQHRDATTAWICNLNLAEAWDEVRDARKLAEKLEVSKKAEGAR